MNTVVFTKNYFCWVSRLYLRKTDQKFKFGGTIGNGDAYLEFSFRHFKVFKLHAILHDAAGAVRAHSGKVPGYCYMIGRGPNSCFFGHITGLRFCLYAKLFLLSIFNSVDFWSSMSCIVLDIELADKNGTKEMGVFDDGKFRDTHFLLQKSTNTQNKRYNNRFLKKSLDRLDTKECKEFRLFVHSVQHTTTRI